MGKIVEFASTKDLVTDTMHPYTIALRSSVPRPNPRIERTRERLVIRGDLPSQLDPPQGCRYHTRCPLAQDICLAEEPTLREHAPGHWAACHFVGEFDQSLRPLAPTRRDLRPVDVRTPLGLR